MMILMIVVIICIGVITFIGWLALDEVEEGRKRIVTLEVDIEFLTEEVKELKKLAFTIINKGSSEHD